MNRALETIAFALMAGLCAAVAAVGFLLDPSIQHEADH